MLNARTDRHAPRQRVSLTVSKVLLEEAKKHGVNLSQAGEAGIMMELKKHKEQRWREENAAGISAYNERINKHGTLIKPIWEVRAEEENGSI